MSQEGATWVPRPEPGPSDIGKKRKNRESIFYEVDKRNESLGLNIKGGQIRAKKVTLVRVSTVYSTQSRRNWAEYRKEGFWLQEFELNPNEKDSKIAIERLGRIYKIFLYIIYQMWHTKYDECMIFKIWYHKYYEIIWGLLN